MKELPCTDHVIHLERSCIFLPCKYSRCSKV